jgi:Fur family ferric uptake transcriptional regulator
MTSPVFEPYYVQSLKRLGLKITLPRLKVLKILEQEHLRHFTAEAVYEALKQRDEDIGIATVYRILTQFETVGLVKKLRFEDGHSIFELQTGEHHDHLVCVRCGSVEEFCDEIVEEQLKVIGKNKQFTMTEHVLVIHGICKNCEPSE